MTRREIPLSKGKVALVDDVDFEQLSRWPWHYAGRYAWRTFKLDTGASSKSAMHREILGAAPGTYVDHVNGDPLDNRRENLRFATITENGRNRRKRSRGRSGFKGVSPAKGRYRAIIVVGGKQISLGQFDTEREAAAAYDLAAREMFCAFAAPNFPEADASLIAQLRAEEKRLLAALEDTRRRLWEALTSEPPRPGEVRRSWKGAGDVGAQKARRLGRDG